MGVAPMPTEGEIKENKIFWQGEWHEVKATKAKVNTENDTPFSLTIGKTTLTGIARPKEFEKSGRKGYTLILDQGQAFFGNGNVGKSFCVFEVHVVFWFMLFN